MRQTHNPLSSAFRETRTMVGGIAGDPPRVCDGCIAISTTYSVVLLDDTLSLGEGHSEEKKGGE